MVEECGGEMSSSSAIFDDVTGTFRKERGRGEEEHDTNRKEERRSVEE